MRRYDVVYILRADAGPDELRYSLRSIEENMTHGKVWFFCGCPDGIVPDVHVRMVQTGVSKWEKVRNTLIRVCSNEEITDKFWLFNDDFYVLQRMTKTTPLHRGELRDHVKGIEQRHGRPSGYTRRLKLCEKRLREVGLPTLDYALHVPMLIDKAKGLETLQMFPDCPMFRSLYGNYAQIGGELSEDVKTVDPDKIIPEDAMFFSTSNKSFAGRVREQLEQRFPEPCRYER